MDELACCGGGENVVVNQNFSQATGCLPVDLQFSKLYTFSIETVIPFTEKLIDDENTITI